MNENNAIDAQPSLRDLVARCNKEKPEAADVEALRRYLADNPGALDNFGDLCDQNINRILTGRRWRAAATEVCRVDLNRKRQQLGYAESPQLERMLINQLLLTWLQLQAYQASYDNLESEGMTLPMAAFWEKRLTAAQGRYLRAVETLARVRKLAKNDPSLQVNITTDNGQAVNVAGDLIKR